MTTATHLPTGTVTFLFSDIEGSTRLLNRLGDAYPGVLEAHQRLLREAFATGGGVEVATEGDSFFMVFPRVAQGVAAAVEGQRALAAHPWPDGAEVRVRMGLHTGEAILGADNYVGVDVHRAARIAEAGHGGQILISGATQALVAQSLPEGVAVRDLGEHRLKDLSYPEHLYQLVARDLDSEFPPPRTLDARPTNLPSQLTSFVGRREEVETLKDLLRQHRLVTLTGPGGTGKTRLSIQVAAETQERFEDGAFFVALAPITDPELVLPTVARTLELPEEPGRPPVDVLVEHLSGKDLLLVLDNMEQVVDAAPRLGELLAASPRLRVLATSREALRVEGEQEYPVPPLELPDVRHLPPVEQLSQYESVALFVQRAAAVKPGFRVTDENAPAVAEITARLDGLPLAIELAAARVKLLGPQAILSRLGDRLSLLAGRSRDRPARQKTLRDAIDWSYHLLDEPERGLFARLAAFNGGFTLEAAEAVCRPGEELGIDVLDGVASLVDKSLLRQTETDHGEPRFFMLETIREYATERLEGDPEADDVRRRHLEFFLALAESAAPELTGERQGEWLDLLEHDHDNVRAAITWAAEHGRIEGALRTAAALWRFWQFRGHLREARTRLDDLLARPESREHPEAGAGALSAAGGVCYWMNDFEAARRYYEEALELQRRRGDRWGEAQALYDLSFTYAVPPPPLLDMEKSVGLLEESRRLFTDLGDRSGTARVLWGLSNAHLQAEEFDRAEEVLRESVELYRQAGDRFGRAWALHSLGLTALRRGQPEAARPWLREGLELFWEVRDLSGVGILLADLAVAAEALGDGLRAVRLAGAVDAVTRATGADLVASVMANLPGWEVLGRKLPQEEAATARVEGASMSVEEAVAYALGEGA